MNPFSTYEDGITKLIFQHESPDGLIESCAGVFAQLLGDDGGIKSAASEVFPRAKLAEYAPPKGKFMLHIVGMGAEEYYGWNKNGDGFSKAALMKYHPTFVSNGHMFREHRNRNPELAIGEIKASAYHPKLHRVELILHGDCEKAAKEYEAAKAGKNLSGSMSCFPAHVNVLLADGNWMPIRDVGAGDRVRTHCGGIGEVTRTMSRHVTEAGILLRPYGTAFDIPCTAEHGIWVRKNHGVPACPVCGRHFKNLKAHLRQKNDTQHQAAYENLGKATEGFWPALSLLPGDEVRIPYDTRVAGVPDEAYAALLGWYVAEGSVFMPSNDKSVWAVDWTLNIDETTQAEQIVNYLVQLNIPATTVSKYLEPDEGRIRVRCRQCELISKLAKDGGKLAAGKQLSPTVMRWRPREQRRLLECWLEGDGSWHKGRKNYLTGVTVSRRLSEQMQIIAWRCGIAEAFAGRGKGKEPGDLIKGHTVKTRAKWVYTLTIRNRGLEQLSVSKIPSNYSSQRTRQFLRENLRHQTGRTAVLREVQAPVRIRLEDGFAYVKLRKVETTWLDEPVYDLTVPGDHGFVVDGGVGVSNCRVPFDVCSCCGNRAKSAAAYCEDLKHHMTQWRPGFQKFAYAQNPDPTFFDYSIVENPADRIAHALQMHLGDLAKAASVNRILSGAELAEFEGVTLLGSGPAAVALPDGYVGMLEKLAGYEQLLEDEIRGGGLNQGGGEGAFGGVGNFDPFVPFLRNVAHRAFDTREHVNLKEASCAPSTLFYELAKRACLLDPASFWSYLEREDPERMEKRAGVHARLPHLFRDLLKQAKEEGGIGNLSRLCDPGSSLSASFDQGYDDKVDKLMDKADALFGVREEPLTARTMIIIKSSDAHLPEATTVQSDTDVRGFTDLYGVYKLAAVQHIAVQHPDIPWQCACMLAVGQNMQLAMNEQSI